MTGTSPVVAAPAGRATPRDPVIDVTRGVAIVLIVIGHVQNGLVRAGMVDAREPWFAVADTAIYLVHLPAFALLAGLFVGRSMERSGTAVYLRRRLVTFAWLYLIWTALDGTISIALSRLVNRPREWGDLLTLWVPTAQFWFLPWLMAMTVLAAFARPWRPGRRAVCVVVAAAGSVALWGLSGPYAGTQGLGLTVFFVLGTAMGASRLTGIAAALPTRRAAAAAALAFVAYAILILTLEPQIPSEGGALRTPATVAAGVAGTVTGTVALLLGCVLLARMPHVAAVLAPIGRRSLEIFLAHVLATSGTRIALLMAGVDAPAVHLVLGTIAGIAAPLLLVAVLERIRFPWLFAAPRALTGDREPGAPGGGRRV